MIDWSGPLTKGRPVYAQSLDVEQGCIRITRPNYDGGFWVGWDRWSDGKHAYDLAINAGLPISP